MTGMPEKEFGRTENTNFAGIDSGSFILMVIYSSVVDLRHSGDLPAYSLRWRDCDDQHLARKTHSEGAVFGACESL